MSFDISKQYDRLYRYCYYHTHNRISSQDIVQEAFTRYMERYGSLDEKNAVPYLYVIARNLCIDHFRRQSIMAEKQLQDQPYGGGQSAEPTTAADNTLLTKLGVQRALSRLTEEERELLLLIRVNEISVREVGLILGISRFAVYRRLRLAQKHLREELGKEGIDGDY